MTIPNINQQEWDYLRSYYIDHPNAPLHPDIRELLDTYLDTRIDRYIRRVTLMQICDVLESIYEVDLLDEYLRYKFGYSEEEMIERANRMDRLINAAQDYVRRKG